MDWVNRHSSVLGALEIVMKVQIVISGQYMENYGAHDWDGKGACPQYWKCKGSGQEVLADQVEAAHAGDLVKLVEWARTQFEVHAYSKYHSSCSYDTVEVFPAGMTGMDRIP